MVSCISTAHITMTVDAPENVQSTVVNLCDEQRYALTVAAPPQCRENPQALHSSSTPLPLNMLNKTKVIWTYLFFVLESHSSCFCTITLAWGCIRRFCVEVFRETIGQSVHILGLPPLCPLYSYHCIEITADDITTRWDSACITRSISKSHLITGRI